MRVFISIFIKDLKLIISDWKMLIIVFIMPVFMILYFSYAIYPILNENTVVEPFKVGMVDNENSIQSRILISQLEHIELIGKMYRVSEDEGVELIENNEIAAIIIIPEGFTSSVVSGENKSIAILGNVKKEQQSVIIKNLIDGATNIVSSGQAVLYSYYKFVDETDIARSQLNKEFNALSEDIIMKSLDRKNVISEIKTYPQDNLTPSEYYTASLLALFLLFSAAPVSKLLLIERNLGITKRVLISNTAGSKIVLSKLILSLLVSIFQIVLIFIVTSKAFNNYWGASFKITAGIFLSGIFAVTCWSLFISTISNTQREFEVINSMGILIMALLGGSIYPLAKMPDLVKPFSAITINRWIQEGFMKVFSGSRHPDISLEVTYLIIIGVIFALLSTVFYTLKKAR